MRAGDDGDVSVLRQRQACLRISETYEGAAAGFKYHWNVLVDGKPTLTSSGDRVARPVEESEARGLAYGSAHADYRIRGGNSSENGKGNGNRETSDMGTQT